MAAIHHPSLLDGKERLQIIIDMFCVDGDLVSGFEIALSDPSISRQELEQVPLVLRTIAHQFEKILERM